MLTLKEISKHTDGSYSLASVVLSVLEDGSLDAFDAMEDLRFQNPEDYTPEGGCDFEDDLRLVKEAVYHFF